MIRNFLKAIWGSNWMIRGSVAIFAFLDIVTPFATEPLNHRWIWTGTILTGVNFFGFIWIRALKICLNHAKCHQLGLTALELQSDLETLMINPSISRMLRGIEESLNKSHWNRIVERNSIAEALVLLKKTPTRKSGRTPKPVKDKAPKPLTKAKPQSKPRKKREPRQQEVIPGDDDPGEWDVDKIIDVRTNPYTNQL
ncbi:unnamed protein product [Tilletia controversa]|nr:unnamed protein product [Tilletia controversa]CAD6922454.1 unnamed protein product [Tilletia controversa]CAD6931664.1 unnamed protein product [Tilletia controversa]CAD6972833.1 unnamed protein product [Tilletia controversa]